MKKLLLTLLVIGSLYTRADTNKTNFIDIYGGAGIFFIITPVFSLGYGKHLTTSSDSYLGFFGISWSVPAIFEARYGYEFMRQNSFAIGLDISALFSANIGLGSSSPGVDHSLYETLQSSLGGGIGLYMRAGITESISALLRTGGWVMFSFDPPSDFPIILPYLELGVRHHF